MRWTALLIADRCSADHAALCPAHILTRIGTQLRADVQLLSETADASVPVGPAATGTALRECIPTEKPAKHLTTLAIDVFAEEMIDSQLLMAFKAGDGRNDQKQQAQLHYK